MPHAVRVHDASDDQDDALIQQVLDPENSIDFSKELEPGEKADDAVDYGDMSDDDLADEEEGHDAHYSSLHRSGNEEDPFRDTEGLAQEEDLPELTNGSGNDGDGFDDLFGDIPSSPTGPGENEGEGQPKIELEIPTSSFDFDVDEQVLNSSGALSELPFSPKPNLNTISEQARARPAKPSVTEAAISKEQQLQQALFAMSSSAAASDFPPAPPENQEELLKSLWPKYERESIPRFMDLLPPKRARYLRKSPTKVPKPIQPTKLSLDLAPDQEKTFKVSYGSSKRFQEDSERDGTIFIQESVGEECSEHDTDMESDSDKEPIGGVTWQDLQIICEDWDTNSSSLPSSPEQSQSQQNLENQSDQQQRTNGWYGPDGRTSLKRRKLNNLTEDILSTPQFAFPSLHDPKDVTSKIARSVVLDLNDPKLLLDVARPDPLTHGRALNQVNIARGRPGSLAKTLIQRFNISNDEAYDALKENHQSKSRSVLGNLTVDHSLPAKRLQWPYYKVKLEKQEARSYHRPLMTFMKNEPVSFSRPHNRKKKHLKGKSTEEVFHTTRDLSLGDNSSVLLLEYSEECPMMMSNVGMGSKVINYYRRKNVEDTTRPKLEIGETAVLMPQDRSPFSVFGHIDPGQTIIAIQNGMYKAPIFKQEAKLTDFLVIRNTTGVEGSTWYMRNVENVHVVGQEFPSVEVPKQNSRKVTTASKNRLKMISYRRLRRNKYHRIGVSEITEHFADTTDMQNRQKMKEFMQFSKEHKEWVMPPGESIPDEDVVRSMVKPEDVCLIESMQVGQQHLQDAGFGKGDGDSDDDDEEKEGRSIEQQLVPWLTSKNFIHATQDKAMLQLHGEGDPSGRGEAFSFLKTSMKGGFKAAGESVEDKLDAKNRKDNGGHTYNVARQKKAYEESIRRIWEAQRQSLSTSIEQSDSELDEDAEGDPPDTVNGSRLQKSNVITPAAFSRREDESASQFSRNSINSQAGKVLRISRSVRDRYGNIEQVEDIIRDPGVIHQYVKQRTAKEMAKIKISEVKPTGDAETDHQAQKILQKELARLERNKDRRLARDKQKGIISDEAAASPGSPTTSATAAVSKPAGTHRKCANCGQVGHIKTNKKLCPLLNGTMKQEDAFTDSPFAVGAPAI